MTYNDVLDHPDQVLGQAVSVSAEVEEGSPTLHAFRPDNHRLLAISVELRLLGHGWVTGEVRQFSIAELEQAMGIDLEDAQLRSYMGEPVIVD